MSEVTQVSREGRYVCVHTGDGHEYGADAVLIASGSTYRRLEVPDEDEYIGAGYPLLRHLRRGLLQGRRGTPRNRRGELRCGRGYIPHNVEVITNSTVAEFKGGKRLETVVIKNTETGAVTERRHSGVFVFIGLTPNTTYLESSVVKLDRSGFIETNATLATSVDGVFAAGDVRFGSTKQATSAAGEGATAALMVRDYLRQKSETAERAAA